MKLLRVFIVAALLPTVLFAAEAPSQKEAPQEAPPAQAAQAASKKTQDVTINAAGATFIVLAVGGILIAALQSGGSIAH